MGLDARRRKIGRLGLLAAAVGCLALALLQLVEPFFFAGRPLSARLIVATSWGVLALAFGALAYWVWRTPPAPMGTKTSE